jgi:serine/threonine protein kinase
MLANLYTHIQHLVQRNGGKPFEFHVEIDIVVMLQIANAMQYLHNKKPRKIVHRDLKMTNILVQPNTNILGGYVHVKLTDFGTSKLYSMSKTSSIQTTKKGTIVYVAP